MFNNILFETYILLVICYCFVAYAQKYDEFRFKMFKRYCGVRC